MAANYSKHFSTKKTAQSEPIPGKKMVENSAGGYVFQVDDFSRLDRFLILGNEGGTYYADEHKLTIENAECVLRCLSSDYKKTVDRIVELSTNGRAPKNDPAIFALAIVAGMGATPEVRSYALDKMPEVCRIGTHLFQFVTAVQQFRGWGRTLKRGVAKWYTNKTVDELAYQVAKYQQRDGFSHRDVLRLCHGGYNIPLYRWITKTGMDGRSVVVKGKNNDRKYMGLNEWNLPEILQAFDDAKAATDAKTICWLIENHNLPRECIPTHWLNEKSVWEALLQKMPMHALVRNLAKMTSIGLLAPMSQAVGKVIAEFANQEKILKSRLHPIAILSALMTYKQGHGDKGKLTWSPVSQIVDALDGAFYKAFGNVTTTGKRWLLACDVSSSMDGGTIAGVAALTPRVGVGALALVTAAVEPQHHIVAFTSGAAGEWRHGKGTSRFSYSGYSASILPLTISPRQRLDNVCREMQGLPMGGTDCALPMLYALQKKIPVDVFVILTDNETWFGDIHPCQALQQYRDGMGIPSKLVVCAMTGTEFTIADPDDFGTMDVVGFDTATPQLMADFANS